MNSRWLFFAAAAALCSLTSSLGAQEKEQTAEGQIKLGAHKYKMEAGSIYEFEVVGNGFRPMVQISGGLLHNSFRSDAGRRDVNTFRGVFLSNENTERTVIVSPGFVNGTEKDSLKYSVTIKPMKLEEKPLFTKEDKITDEDPVLADKTIPGRKTHFKSYQVKLKADQICVIEMNPKKEAKGRRLLPKLSIESDDKQLAQAGGSGNAVLVFRAPVDGEYRILATGLSQNLDIGEFTLTVRTVK